MLHSLAEITGVSTHFISLAVSDHCDTPPYDRPDAGVAYAELTFSLLCATPDHVGFVAQHVRQATKATKPEALPD